MPFIFIGALASVVGWFLFLSGLGLESNALTRTLVSVHFGSLASNIINFGIFFDARRTRATIEEVSHAAII